MAVSGITAPVPRGGMGFTYDPVYGPLYYFRGQYYSPDQVQSYETSEAGTSYDGVIRGATPFVPTQQTATMGQAPSGYMTLQQAAATKGGGRPEAPQNRFDIYEREGWAKLLPQLGFQGQVQSSTYTPDESVEGGMRESFGLTPEAQSFINNLKQQGYQIVADKDKVWSGSKYTTRLGLADPQGNILSNWEEQEGSYFDQLGPMLAAFTPAFLGIGNALASGAVGGGANALAGAGIGGIEGAAFADLAAGMLPEFGTNAAYSAGLSGGTGLGGALTLQDIGGGIGDVLNAASEASEGASGAVDVGGALDMADPEIAKLFRQGKIAQAGGSPLAGIGPNAMALPLVSPTPALEMASFSPMTNVVSPVVTPAAAITDLAAGIGPDLAGVGINALEGVGLSGDIINAATGSTLATAAPVVGASVNALNMADPEIAKLVRQGEIAQAGGSPLAGIGPGAVALPLVAGGSSGTGIPFLDKAIDFVTSPAGSAIVSGVGNVVGGIAGANAAEKAAETQAGAADRALQLQREMYEKSLELGKPYYEAGVNALGKLTRGEILPEPGYAFRLGEGMKALERVQAARGNMLSGGALKAGQRYAQDLASQEYGNAYNRLANIAGLGQTATTQAGTAGQNYASQAGELGLQQANALARGRVSRASSYGNALLGAAGALQDYVQAPMKEQMFRDIYGRLMGKP